MASKSRSSGKRHSGRGPTPRRATENTIAASRYTPPSRRPPRYRPTWHKAVGGLSVVAGLVLFFFCRFNVGHIHDYGGHVWYLLGFAVAGTSVWWWGGFDPAD